MVNFPVYLEVFPFTRASGLGSQDGLAFSVTIDDLRMLAVGFLSICGGIAKSVFGRNGRRVNRSVEKRFDLRKRLLPNSHRFSTVNRSLL